jgi:hypothetical protein
MKKNIVFFAGFMLLNCYLYGMDFPNHTLNEIKKLSPEEQIRENMFNLSSKDLKAREEAKRNIQEIIEIHNSTEVDVEEYPLTGHHIPLTHAIENNDIEFARFLLEKNANPNYDVKMIHSSKPIFFAKTPEMAELLVSKGARLDVINKGTGVTSDMDLLHSSINYNTENNKLFVYYLEKGLNPKVCLADGDNLWHSLISTSISYCPEERFIFRANRLHELDISPDQKNKGGLSALELVEEAIKEEKEDKNYFEELKKKQSEKNISDTRDYDIDINVCKRAIARLELFVLIMQKRVVYK